MEKAVAETIERNAATLVSTGSPPVIPHASHSDQNRNPAHRFATLYTCAFCETVMRPLPLIAVALLASACSTLPPSRCDAGAQALVEDALYFGLSIPGGGTVGEAQWQQFLRDEVTPRFPQGLSVVDAAGQWRGNDGSVVREPSRVLTLVHPDDAAHEAAIRAIVDAYRTRFAQEAVMRLKQRTCASF